MIEKYDLIKAVTNLAKPLAAFLEEYLPQKDVDWWNNRVLPSFDNSKKVVNNLKHHNLLKLDTAALLKIFINNVSYLQELAGYDYHSTKNIANECQTIRIKCMHISPESDDTADDIARYFDTLYRLASVIKADSSYIQELNERREYFYKIVFNISEPEMSNNDIAEEVVSVSNEEVSMPEEDNIPYVQRIPQMQQIPVMMMGMNTSMPYGVVYNNIGLRY